MLTCTRVVIFNFKWFIDIIINKGHRNEIDETSEFIGANIERLNGEFNFNGTVFKFLSCRL